MIEPRQEQQLERYAREFTGAVNARRALMPGFAAGTVPESTYDDATKAIEQAAFLCGCALAAIYVGDNWLSDVDV